MVPAPVLLEVDMLRILVEELIAACAFTVLAIINTVLGSFDIVFVLPSLNVNVTVNAVDVGIENGGPATLDPVRAKLLFVAVIVTFVATGKVEEMYPLPCSSNVPHESITLATK
jgi:hypothetical protein